MSASTLVRHRTLPRLARTSPYIPLRQIWARIDLINALTRLYITRMSMPSSEACSGELACLSGMHCARERPFQEPACRLVTRAISRSSEAEFRASNSHVEKAATFACDGFSTWMLRACELSACRQTSQQPAKQVYHQHPCRAVADTQSDVATCVCNSLKEQYKHLLLPPALSYHQFSMQ